MKNTHQEFLEVIFSGNNIRPDSVKAGDIADILKAIEVMVESQVYRQHPEIKKDQIIIGLSAIKPSSIDLQFSSSIHDITLLAFKNIGQAINEGDFSRLPSQSYKALTTVASFTRRQQCVAEFSYQNGRRNIIARITPDTKIERPPSLEGQTTIYAKVVRTGGKAPKVEIETINGRTLFCDAPKDVTIKLGTKLYQTVALIGFAEWDTDLDNIEQFRIDAVLDYEQVPIKDALHALSEATKLYYADIKDVEGYISKIRGSN